MEALAELEEPSKTSAQTAAALESLKKKSAADIETLQQEKAKLSNELTATLTEARDKARDLEAKLAAEQVKVATLREEKQKLMSGTTTAQEEIAKLQKRAGELETQAALARELENRLADRDQEIGKLRQAAADREPLTSKVAALMQEREQLNAELLRLQETRGGEQPPPPQEAAAEEAEKQRLTKIPTDLTGSLEAEIAKGDIRIQQGRDRLTITILDRLLFESGKSQVKPSGLKVLKRVSEIFKNVTGSQIHIAGHTDYVRNGAKLKERFPATWNLCTARATNVIRSLLEQGGLAQAIGSSVGCVHTTEGRPTNRFIEILLLPKDLPEATSGRHPSP